MNVEIGIPQIIVVATFGIILDESFKKHGRPRKRRKHNIWESIMGVSAIMMILIWGGFF